MQDTSSICFLAVCDQQTSEGAPNMNKCPQQPLSTTKQGRTLLTVSFLTFLRQSGKTLYMISNMKMSSCAYDCCYYFVSYLVWAQSHVADTVFLMNVLHNSLPVIPPGHVVASSSRSKVGSSPAATQTCCCSSELELCRKTNASDKQTWPPAAMRESKLCPVKTQEGD